MSMLTSEIANERLLRQRISGEGLERPADVVRWMGAVQAQDYSGAKWALGLRTQTSTDADLEAAFATGAILRTHVMRPTWHFIAPEDLHWMQALTSQRVCRQLSYQIRQLELDSAVFKRTDRILEKALRDGQQLTRAELSSTIARAGIPTTGLRITHMLARAELDALICSGGRRGKQFTYALVAERAPYQRQLASDEALAELTMRYFASHGPATSRDFAWWSGLPSADIKAGIDMVKSRLICETIDGQEYRLMASAPAARLPRGAAHLLSNYDEYIVGYTDRSAVFDPIHAADLDARHNPLFQHTIVSSGRIVGTWKRTASMQSLGIQTKFFVEPRKAEVRALGLASKRLAHFLQLQIADFRL